MEDFKTPRPSDEGQIIVTKRQASMITASFFVFALSVFIVGYFLGKRSVLEDFSAQVTQDSLNNQIDYLLTSQAVQSADDSDISSSDQKDENDNILDDVSQANIKDFSRDSNVDQHETKEDLQSKSSEPVPAQESKPKKHKQMYAQLVGFGTKRAALAFAARLKEKDVHVIIKTRTSKTAKGKKRTWYQAVTPIMSDEKEFKKVIAKIQRLEHIRSSDIKTVHIKQK